MRALGWWALGALAVPAALFGLVFLVAIAGAAALQPAFSSESGQPPAGAGAYLWPVPSHTITSPFGERVSPTAVADEPQEEIHWGVDIQVDAGAPVAAATSGRIHYAGWAGNYGRLIILIGPGGSATWYGHLSEFAVQQGQMVEVGQVIGYVGNTGRSTGTHLHFEIRPDGTQPVDPLRYYRGVQ